MSNLAVIPLFGLFILAIFYRFSFAKKAHEFFPHDRTIWPAFSVLAISYVITLATLEARTATDIIDLGLSRANLIRVAASSLVIVYAIHVLKYRSVWTSLLHWPSFLLMLLVLIYLISALWSVWPEATLFRAIEVFAYFTVAMFLVMGRNGYQRMYLLLLIIMASTFIMSAGVVLESIASRGIYRSLVSNQLGLIAASYTLLHAYLFPRRIFGYIFGIMALLAFGSTSTIAAFSIALGVFLGFKLTGSRSHFSAMALSILGVFVFGLSLVDPGRYPVVVNFAVNVLGREEHHFTGATGRWVLWEVYFLEFRENLIGGGFWSAERLFSRDLGTFGVWQATNAHNGFWSAWIGAGVVALLLLIGVYLSLVKELLRNGGGQLGLGLALTILLLLNSLTYPGIGGAASTWYFVLAFVVVSSMKRAHAWVECERTRLGNGAIEVRPR